MIDLAASAELHVPGPPTGKGRPRWSQHSQRMYTPAATTHAQERVEAAWRRVGEPYLGRGPIECEMEVVVCRPGGHFKKTGELSAAGLRATHPTKKPDLDNVLKLFADAGNRTLYHDDQQIAKLAMTRRWAEPGEREGVVMRLQTIGDPVPDPGVKRVAA